MRVAYERRNRDLDPQLVWRGKDEQDWSDLVVQAPPLYIQEKVHPKVIIDDLVTSAQWSVASGKAATNYQPPATQLDLFADFNGVPEGADKTDFYQHDQNWSNRMILGDSLQVMASLAEREGLRGKVQCIYIDPPYGIKFNSNFQWSTTTRDVRDGNPDHITREPEQVRAFRDTWRDGIHSYLTYLRERLTVSRDLLAESGSIFVQIGDENVHRVRALMDEVFGASNSVSEIVFQKTGGQTSDYLPSIQDYVLWYARDRAQLKYRQLLQRKELGVGHGSGARYDQLDDEGNAYQLTSLTSNRPPGDFPVEFQGKLYGPSGGSAGKVYVVQTSPAVLQRCILMASDPGDLVLDPTCGSGTTAYVAEQCGRRWITIDTSRVALALARARIMGARYPYYLLKDSREGQLKEAEITRTAPSSQPVYGSLRQGFVYERVPHITLKSTANNAEIDVIWEKWQETLEPLRRTLNAALGTAWAEWEIPREAANTWPASVKQAHADWWQARIARQKEIDASIAAKAEFEYLYDKPYEDRKKVRVAGPFTVESLSPHRVLGVDEDGDLIDGIADGAAGYGEG